MEKKTETKLWTRFSGRRARTGERGAMRVTDKTGEAFMIPPPYFNIESARNFPGCRFGLSFFSWF